MSHSSAQVETSEDETITLVNNYSHPLSTGIFAVLMIAAFYPVFASPIKHAKGLLTLSAIALFLLLLSGFKTVRVISRRDLIMHIQTTFLGLSIRRRTVSLGAIEKVAVDQNADAEDRIFLYRDGKVSHSIPAATSREAWSAAKTLCAWSNAVGPTQREW